MQQLELFPTVTIVLKAKEKRAETGGKESDQEQEALR